jgi:hypothetical protein
MHDARGEHSSIVVAASDVAGSAVVASEVGLAAEGASLSLPEDEVLDASLLIWPELLPHRSPLLVVLPLEVYEGFPQNPSRALLRRSAPVQSG